MVKIRKDYVSKLKYLIKCPYKMNATRIVIHNTANDATAANEIAYMKRNNSTTSFHYAVDDKEAVQGISVTRNAWHASDGRNGKGNREGIAIEICYSKSGGKKWLKAVDNAAQLTALLLHNRNWDIGKVTKHQDYGNHKYCPHRILSEYGWDNFLKLTDKYLKEYKVKSPKNEKKPAKAKKSNAAIAKEVLLGKWGNGNERKIRLKEAGYDYKAVQKLVNEMLRRK